MKFRFQFIHIIKILSVLLLSISIAACNNNDQDLDINIESGHLQMLRISGLALSPAFEITHKHYVSTADFSVNKINLQAWTKFSGDSVSVNAKPLEQFNEHPLAVGNNLFNIIVTTSNGELEHYQLTVTRLNKMASNN